MIKKLWVKFNELDVVCVCNEKSKKCMHDTDCSEYIVKFMPIDRVDKANTVFSTRSLADSRRRLTSALNTTANHIKNITKKIK